MPQVGASKSEIQTALGEPIGRISYNDKVILLYPQGDITLRNDRASQVDIKPESVYLAEQAHLEKERGKWALQQARLSEKRAIEGEKLKSAKLKSADFAALPAKNRANYWQSFKNRYPEVDVTEELSDAMDSYQLEVAEIRRQQELNDLKSKIAEAEKARAEAELEAQRLRNSLNTSRGFGLRYYTTTPRVHCNPPYKPPTITIHSNRPGTHKGPNHFKDSWKESAWWPYKSNSNSSRN